MAGSSARNLMIDQQRAILNFRSFLFLASLFEVFSFRRSKVFLEGLLSFVSCTIWVTSACKSTTRCCSVRWLLKAPSRFIKQSKNWGRFDSCIVWLICPITCVKLATILLPNESSGDVSSSVRNAYIAIALSYFLVKWTVIKSWLNIVSWKAWGSGSVLKITSTKQQ